MLEVESPPASDAAEEHVFGIVNAASEDLHDWIIATIIVTFFLFLHSGFARAEWQAGVAVLAAFRAFALIWGDRIFLLGKRYATPALQYKLPIVHLGD